MQPIDFAGLNRLLLADAEGFVRELVPDGRRMGQEYVAASISGGEGRSFSVNLNTGIFKDFADDTGGKDLISLYAKVHNLNNGKAAHELQKRYSSGTSADTRPNGRARANEPAPVQQKPAVIVPDGVRDPDFTHPQHGSVAKVWKYCDAEGRTWGYVGRYNFTDANGDPDKAYCPFTYDGKRWNKRHWPQPYPLYGLDDLALRPDLSVVVVEGEAAADAARKLCPRQVVITWPGGAKRWHLADFSAVYGRRVVLWPDADRAGIEAMQGLARALQGHCPSIKMFDVSDRPAKWDAADALQEGWTTASFAQWAKAKLIDVPVLVSDVSTTIPAAVKPTPGVAVSKMDGQPLIVSPYVRWTEWNLDCNGNGIPHPNLNNAVTILERDPACQGLIWFDEFLQKFQTPGEQGPREWQDVDDIHLILYMQRDLGVHRMGADAVRGAIREIAMRRRRHVVRDWIDSLVWDGEPRVDMFFADHFGADNTAYTQAASRNFWLSMLARVYRPGCKVDTMIVLESEQGERKSTAMQIIGGDWSTVQHASVTGKEFFEVMQGKLLIEIGEMDAFTRADITRVKDVISCSTDRFRVPYAQYASDHPRQCIFAGTTNRDDWHKDETGARRFHPLRCRTVDVDAIAKWRDEYFAEARHRLAPDTPWVGPGKFIGHFAGGENWWTMPDDETTAQQRERLQEDPWQAFIEEYIHFEKMGDGVVKRMEPLQLVTVNDILLNALQFKERSRIQRADERRVGACLTSMGWRKRIGKVSGENSEDKYGKIWRRIVRD